MNDLKILIVFIISGLHSCNDVANNNSKSKENRIDRLPYYNEATFTPNWIELNDPRLDTFHKISSFKLINQDGDTITEKNFEGKIYIVDFFFTSCPGICPNMTANMALIQDKFIKDNQVLLLSHSVTPDKDSVPILKLYAESNAVISSKWHLATGSQKVIYKLGRKDYFVEENLGLNRKPNDFLHTENFVLIDTRGHIRGIYNGLRKASIRQLIKDIYILKENL